MESKDSESFARESDDQFKTGKERTRQLNTANKRKQRLAAKRRRTVFINNIRARQEKPDFSKYTRKELEAACNVQFDDCMKYKERINRLEGNDRNNH